MIATSAESVSNLSNRSLAVALITIARYIADQDQSLLPYLDSSLEHAVSSSLPETDLAALRLVITAIGGQQAPGPKAESSASRIPRSVP